MAYDSAATRARLLEAAYAEFVERGLAGARVERITSTAVANKQAIYAYFGSKEALFDAVLENRLGILADAVPFTTEDLTGCIGELFDHLVAEPVLVRLTQWKALERPEATAPEVEPHRAKAAGLAQAHHITGERGMDVFMLTLARAMAWSTTPEAIRDAGRKDVRARLRRHRCAVISAVSVTVGELLVERPLPKGRSRIKRGVS